MNLRQGIRIFGCILLMYAPLHADFIVWLGGGDGVSWSDPANWSSGVPGPGDTAGISGNPAEGALVLLTETSDVEVLAYNLALTNATLGPSSEILRFNDDAAAIQSGNGTYTINPMLSFGNITGSLVIDGGAVATPNRLILAGNFIPGLSLPSSITLQNRVILSGNNQFGAFPLIFDTDAEIILANQGALGDLLGAPSEIQMGGATSIFDVADFEISTPIQFVGINANIFDVQAFDATLSGALSGISPVIKQGVGTLTIEGTGTHAGLMVANNGTLNVNGSIPNSIVSISPGAYLTGTGTVGSVNNSGTIAPGNSIGTLTVNGPLSFDPGGVLEIEVSPTGSDLLNVTGTATLTNGALSLVASPGFYGRKSVYTILNAGSIVDTFSTSSLSGDFFNATLSYTPTSVLLTFFVDQVFLNFPFGNTNEESVGNNVDQVIFSGSASADFLAVTDQFSSLSIDELNRALDQMHPAAMGAFADLQVNLGGELLSLFHKRPTPSCGCQKENRIWVQPFGNWLREKAQGIQVGFHTVTGGLALGYDHTFSKYWTVGVGGAWNRSHLSWSLGRGYADINGAYGALYSDFSLGRYYLGFSTYAGKDWYDTTRHIQFADTNRNAKASFGALDCGAQMSSAYFFGTPTYRVYPYLVLDYLYLHNGHFSEHGANSIDLRVDPYSSSNFRSDTGVGFQYTYRNKDQTLCVAPLVSIGYTALVPLDRDHFQATFAGQTVSFSTVGWDQTWSLITFQFGLGITYRCFHFDSEYIGNLAPNQHHPFLNQRVNFRLSASF